MTSLKRKILLGRMAVAVLCLAATATVISIINDDQPGKPIRQMVPPAQLEPAAAMPGGSAIFTFQASNGEMVSLAIDPAQSQLANAPPRHSWNLNMANQSNAKIVFVYHSALPPVLPLATLRAPVDAMPFPPPAPRPAQFDVYQLTIERSTLADIDASVQVPEPGSLALIGLGLLGMSLIPGLRLR